MRRFVLTNSSIFRESPEEGEQYLPPLGLGYIATYLEKSGVNVEILDCVKEKKSVFDTIKYINEMRPDYIGINIFTQNYDLLEIAIVRRGAEPLENTLFEYLQGVFSTDFDTINNMLMWKTITK